VAANGVAPNATQTFTLGVAKPSDDSDDSSNCSGGTAGAGLGLTLPVLALVGFARRRRKLAYNRPTASGFGAAARPLRLFVRGRHSIMAARTSTPSAGISRHPLRRPVLATPTNPSTWGRFRRQRRPVPATASSRLPWLRAPTAGSKITLIITSISCSLWYPQGRPKMLA
jgi:MYXO-CTERM domain-containing protein